MHGSANRFPEFEKLATDIQKEFEDLDASDRPALCRMGVVR